MNSTRQPMRQKCHEMLHWRSVSATNISSGSWYVEGVPLNEDGTAVVQARAIPLTDNGGNGSGGQNTTFDDPGNPDSPSDITTEADLDKNPEVVMVHYEKNRSYLSLTRAEYPTKKQTKEIIRWDVQQTGSWFDDYCGGNTFGSHMYYVCNSRNWESNGIGMKSWEDRGRGKCAESSFTARPHPTRWVALLLTQIRKRVPHSHVFLLTRIR